MSREKQIDEIAKLICTYPQCTNYNVIGGCKIADCQTVDVAERLYNAGYRKQEWISVEERLPERGQEVLVYRGDFIGDMMKTYTYLGSGNWEDDYGYRGDAEHEGITHWMPLPEPPKGE